MGKITDIHNAWRDALQPASFRNARFHVETGRRENGRRIVVHEFPKKDTPYPEDMGRRAIQFTVRGYCITYPFDTADLLYNTDYRKARDALITELEREGPGMLQLPTLTPMLVVNSQYSWAEEERYGGYCTFDMTFVEYGVPAQAKPSSSANLAGAAATMTQGVQQILAGVTERMRVDALTQATPPGPG